MKTAIPNIESAAFTMQDVLEICSQDPPLEQRQAIHLVQTETVSHRLLVSSTAKRRLYSFLNLMEFEIGRTLYVGFGIPPASVKQIIKRLHQGGFFLSPNDVRKIDEEKKLFDRPEAFREHLNKTYGIDLLLYSSPNNLVQRGNETVIEKRSDRQNRNRIRQIARKVTRLARKTSRPWEIYVLVYRSGDSWKFDEGSLPGGHYLETEGDTPELKIDQESYRQFAELLQQHPHSILLNLHEIESELRRRFEARNNPQDGQTGAS